MITPPKQAVDARTPYPLHRFAHDAMACTFELYLVEEDAKYAWQAAEAAFAEADRLERELSRFVPTSDIARINTLSAGRATRVGIDAFECLQQAIRLYVETGGAFDVTFGSQINRAFGGQSEAARYPTMHLLQCDRRQHEVGVQATGVRIDLGGIGKGYAIDQMVTLLREWSISSGLIHAGQSSVYALGSPPEAAAWRVALRDPARHEQTLGSVELEDAALSGSGRRLHGEHIIDPATGRPVGGVSGAWARAKSAAVSDALATAFMVMPPQQVERYCRQHADVAAILAPQGARQRELLCFGTEIQR
jgi:thiamine biosynthesis lipoprotein